MKQERLIPEVSPYLERLRQDVRFCFAFLVDTGAAYSAISPALASVFHLFECVLVDCTAGHAQVNPF